MENFISDCLFNDEITPILLKGNIRTPDKIDVRDRMLPTEDQGVTSTCAAHAATSWLENIMWMRTGVPVNYDPYKLYKEAKRIDGYPNEEGTTLSAVLKGIINLGWFDTDVSNVVCYGNDVTNLKRQIHKYEVILGAFEVSELWMNHKDKLYMYGAPGKSFGGHAVIICGFDDNGVYIQNSWGRSFGKYGYALISWDLVHMQLKYIGVMKNCLDNLD